MSRSKTPAGPEAQRATTADTPIPAAAPDNTPAPEVFIYNGMPYEVLGRTVDADGRHRIQLKQALFPDHRPFAPKPDPSKFLIFGVPDPAFKAEDIRRQRRSVSIKIEGGQKVS